MFITQSVILDEKLPSKNLTYACPLAAAEALPVESS